jgi:cell wall-associated NlpC family hydrolase
VALTRAGRRYHLLISAAILAATTTLVLSAPRPATAAPPPPPAPTTSSVIATLDSLADQTESLTEQYNAAQADVSSLQTQGVAAQQTASQASADFQVARADLARLVTANYEMGSSFSHAGALFTSTSQQNYVDTVATMNLLASHRSDVLARLGTTKAVADAAHQNAAGLLAAATAKRDALTTQRDTIAAQTAKFSSLLATLTTTQRQDYTNRHAPTPAELTVALALPAPSAAARKVVTFALAQVGKPYVFAASGPGAFDCSGLTMAAWATVGVQLPHFAAAQYTYGTHIAESALQPGDLVFLYGDIHHVELYIGNGLAVSAPQEGENVKVIKVADFQNVYHGATRLTA